MPLNYDDRGSGQRSLQAAISIVQKGEGEGRAGCARKENDVFDRNPHGACALQAW